jgi:hypothetical protein
MSIFSVFRAMGHAPGMRVRADENPPVRLGIRYGFLDFFLDPVKPPHEKTRPDTAKVPARPREGPRAPDPSSESGRHEGHPKAQTGAALADLSRAS